MLSQTRLFTPKSLKVNICSSAKTSLAPHGKKENFRIFLSTTKDPPSFPFDQLCSWFCCCCCCCYCCCWLFLFVRGKFIEAKVDQEVSYFGAESNVRSGSWIVTYLLRPRKKDSYFVSPIAKLHGHKGKKTQFVVNSYIQ